MTPADLGIASLFDQLPIFAGALVGSFLVPALGVLVLIRSLAAAAAAA
jgi:hypothetical protein